MKNAGQEYLKKSKLLKIIRDWVAENREAFWKYEGSCYYKTYIVKVTNLPEPSAEDIMISSYNQLLDSRQITELCDAIKTACAESMVSGNSCIKVQVGYEKNTITAEVV